MGGCAVANVESLVVRDCDEASRSVDAADKFFVVSVPELVPPAVAAAHTAADLARKTAARLAGKTADLKQALPALAACGTSQVRSALDSTPLTEPVALVVSAAVGKREAARVMSPKRPL